MVSSLIFQKFSGEGLTSSLPRPLPPLFPSNQIITNDFSWKWQLNHFVSHFKYCFKYAPNECFKFDFSKFSGEGSPSPLPRPLPRFSRASPSVRASPSILGRFAPSTRASPSILGRFAPSIRASPSTFDLGTLVWPPQNKFLDPPLMLKHAIKSVISLLCSNDWSIDPWRCLEDLIDVLRAEWKNTKIKNQRDWTYIQWRVLTLSLPAYHCTVETLMHIHVTGIKIVKERKMTEQ